MDVNCGISNPYLKPSFLIKVATGIFAFATLIYMFVLDTNLYEYVWRKPIKNGNLAATLTAFFILAIIVTVFIHFRFVEQIPYIGNNKLYQVIIAGSFAGLTLLIALIFGGKNSSKSNYKKISNLNHGTFVTYWEVDHKDDEKYKEWEHEHSVDKDKYAYMKNRTTKAASNVLGLFIFLAILDAALLFYLYKEDSNDGFTNISEPINTDKTPSYN